VKDIHLTLQVKTFIGTLHPWWVSVWNSALRSLDFSLLAVINIVRRERRRNMYTKSYKAKIK
jgi:hypothetical protein